VAPVRVSGCAQQAVPHARGEAGRLGHDRVGTEHLPPGLAREGAGVAARVLEDLGAGLPELREAALYTAGTEPEPLLPPPDAPGEGRPLVVSTVVL
jgi:hypothetical protein